MMLRSMELTPNVLVKMLDYSCLRNDATLNDVTNACNTARLYGFDSLTVAPCWVEAAAKMLEGSDVKVSSVVAFPLGHSTTETKIAEALRACRDGARQLHIVMNISAFKSRHYALVRSEFLQVKDAVERWAPQLVAIIEAPLLTPEEVRTACGLTEGGGVSVVKNCTGFGAIGARSEDIAAMRAALSPHILVKAAGGIKSLDYAVAMIEAGAGLIGSSAAPAIVDELRRIGRIIVKTI